MRPFALFIAFGFPLGGLMSVGFAQDSAQAEAAEEEAPQGVSADPSADLDAADLDQAARLLFESASRAYELGNFTDALARYTNAYQLSGRAQLLYNIAICHDRLDQKSEAADFYERFVAEVPNSPRVGIARSRGEILRASLGADAQTSDPQEAVPAAEDVPDGGQVDVPPPTASRSLIGPIASFAVGGAGLVTFVVAALISGSRLSDCESGSCDDSQLDDVDRASLVADIGLGVAIAGAAAGVVWLLVGGGEDADEGQANARFAPVASPSAFGAQVSGSF